MDRCPQSIPPNSSGLKPTAPALRNEERINQSTQSPPPIQPRNPHQEKGKAHGVFFESVPAGQNLPDLGLDPAQQYLYLEAPGLGGKGVQRSVDVDVDMLLGCLGFGGGWRAGGLVRLPLPLHDTIPRRLLYRLPPGGRLPLQYGRWVFLCGLPCLLVHPVIHPSHASTIDVSCEHKHRHPLLQIQGCAGGAFGRAGEGQLEELRAGGSLLFVLVV